MRFKQVYDVESGDYRMVAKRGYRTNDGAVDGAVTSPQASAGLPMWVDRYVTLLYASTVASTAALSVGHEPYSGEHLTRRTIRCEFCGKHRASAQVTVRRQELICSFCVRALRQLRKDLLTESRRRA